MENEPRNAAADAAYSFVDRLSDRDLMKSEMAHDVFAPGFMRFDYRRLTAQPPADTDQFLANLGVMEELGGRWPTITLTQMLAVRGARLVAARATLAFGDMGDLEFIGVLQFDEGVERTEMLWMYDDEDLDGALAQLDQAHAQVASG